MENLNLLFYKTFYSKLGKDDIFDNDIYAKSKKLVDSRFYKEDYKPVCEAVAPERFMLKTAYPGLLAGTGYAHGVDSESDIKVGFSFDYVTGQPYIPGSSVKGLLRSYFEHTEVIKEILKENEINIDIDDVELLEKSIFGTQDEASDDGADVFFDAVIVRGTERRFDNDKDFGRVMGYDAITPHGKDLTKNPVPIKILKVLPDVVFEFSFRLQDSVINGKTVTKKQKEELFKKILCYFGIGAKTNVGYGVLEEYKEEELERYVWPARKINQPEIGKYYDCTITGVKVQPIGKETKCTLFVHIDSLGKRANISCNFVPEKIKKNFNNYYKKGDRIVSKITKIYDDGGIGMSYECAKK